MKITKSVANIIISIDLDEVRYDDGTIQYDLRTEDREVLDKLGYTTSVITPRYMNEYVLRIPTKILRNPEYNIVEGLLSDDESTYDYLRTTLSTDEFSQLVVNILEILIDRLQRELTEELNETRVFNISKARRLRSIYFRHKNCKYLLSLSDKISK